mmetsp:Transcript_15020/g.30410  ORF Transcript_15020/g.30410 Transcript_15020/m.30410 type:complete len:137 (-) Transcript_15020:183-593(-)
MRQVSPRGTMKNRIQGYHEIEWIPVQDYEGSSRCVEVIGRCVERENVRHIVPVNCNEIPRDKHSGWGIVKKSWNALAERGPVMLVTNEGSILKKFCKCPSKRTLREQPAHSHGASETFENDFDRLFCIEDDDEDSP